MEGYYSSFPPAALMKNKSAIKRLVSVHVLTGMYSCTYRYYQGVIHKKTPTQFHLEERVPYLPGDPHTYGPVEQTQISLWHH